MLRYIITFTLFFLILTGVIFYQYKLLRNTIVETNVKSNAKNLSDAFTNLIWNKYSFMLNMNDYNISKWKLTPQFLKFENESKIFFENLGLLQVEIFSKYDDKLFSLKNYFEHNHHASSHDFKTNNSDALIDNKHNMIIVLPLLGENEYNAIIEMTFDLDKVIGKIRNQWYRFSVFILSLVILFALWIFYKLYSGSKTLNEQFIINAKLKSAKEDIEQISLQKSQFLANVSHELKTPLNAIIGFSDLIQSAPDGIEKHKEYARDIYNSGNHLLNLINDILDFSKSEVNKLKVRSNIFELTKLINTCIRMTTSTVKNIKVNTTFFDEKVLIKSDHKRMKQVLLNILSNSVKFTNEPAIIDIDVKKINNEIIIKISDNGIGIAEKDLAKALSVFGQASSNLSRNYEGTGIGLPFSKKLVELMGGIFDIESKEDYGTTVTISFPYNEDDFS
jgi:two-component system cell cycle sensor histidine kinase PleC